MSSSLVVSILLLMRILVLKLKSENLNDLFKSLWSSILFLLEKVINKQGAPNQDQVLISSLKLIDLISELNLEEFNLFRSAFLVDYQDVSFTKTAELQDVQYHFSYRPILLNKVSRGTVVKHELDYHQEEREYPLDKIFYDNVVETIEQFLMYQKCPKSKSIGREQYEIEVLKDFTQNKGLPLN